MLDQPAEHGGLEFGLGLVVGRHGGFLEWRPAR